MVYTVPLPAAVLIALFLLFVFVLLLRENALAYRRTHRAEEALRAANARAKSLSAGLEDIHDAASLPCGCSPCMGACYSRDALRDEVVAIGRRARHALRAAWLTDKSAD